MNQTQRIRLGLLLTNIKLGGRFSFRTYTADANYPKDPDPKNWRTINGSKVHLTNGKIDGGAGGKFKGNPWLGKKPHGHNSFFPPKGWVKKEPEPEPENEHVPFGSPAPAPSTASEKPPIGIINTMKGTFKNSSKEVQTDVSNFLKSGDINELPVFPNGVDMLNDELCQKAYNAWKNKMITKTAAQNIVAKAVGTPDSYIVKLAAESWGDVPAAPAKTKTAKPKVATKTPTANPSTPTVTYNNLTSSEKDEIKFAKLAVENGFSPEEIGALHLNNPKKEFAEMAVALIEDYNDNPTAGKQENLHDKLAQIMKGQYKASKEDLAVYKAWKNSSKVQKQLAEETIKQTLYTEGPKAKAAGLMQTPNTCSVDLSEKATGIKTPKGTLNLVAAKGHPGAAKLNDPAFVNFANDQASQLQKLTQKQKQAIWRYTAGSTHTMKYLVYGETDDYYKESSKNGKASPYKNGMTAEALQKVCDNISAGLKKVKHPDLWVSRACSLMDWATADNPGGISLAELKVMAKSGETFENKAFLSTSPSEVPTFSLGSATAVCRRFYVPQKAPGAYIDSLSEYSTKDGCHEYEFLLDKNSKTRIMKVEEVNGVIYTYEEVIV